MCSTYLVFSAGLDATVLMHSSSGSWERYSYSDAHMLSEAYAFEEPKVICVYLNYIYTYYIYTYYIYTYYIYVCSS